MDSAATADARANDEVEAITDRRPRTRLNSAEHLVESEPLDSAAVEAQDAHRPVVVMRTGDATPRRHASERGRDIDLGERYAPRRIEV